MAASGVELAARAAAVALVLGATCLAAAAARAQPASPVPPPEGTRPTLELEADGVQIYVCESRDGSWAWAFKGPEATLFDAAGRQVGRHGAGPSWTLHDGSSATARVAATAPSPRPGAIPWLLLRATPGDAPGALRGAAWIRRLDTVGGVAPAGGCDAGRAGETARMRYSARYTYHAD